MLIPATAFCQDHSQVAPSLHLETCPPDWCLCDTAMLEGNKLIEPHTQRLPLSASRNQVLIAKFRVQEFSSTSKIWQPQILP